MERSLAVYTTIKLLGAAYLIYLGVQAFRHRRDLAAALDQAVPALPTGQIFRQGVLVGVSNSKGFLLFAAILPQFTDPTAGWIPLQLLLLGLVCVLIALASDSVLGPAGQLGPHLAGPLTRRLETIGGGAGAVMVGLGVQVAITGRRD